MSKYELETFGKINFFSPFVLNFFAIFHIPKKVKDFFQHRQNLSGFSVLLQSLNCCNKTHSRTYVFKVKHIYYLLSIFTVGIRIHRRQWCTYIFLLVNICWKKNMATIKKEKGAVGKGK